MEDGAQGPGTAPALPGVEPLIRIVRGQRVMLDSDLAALYGVETRVLTQAVLRNLARFPADFMFQLTETEFEGLRSQTVTSNGGRGGRRYRPRVFTEQGVAMLSSVLHSELTIPNLWTTVCRISGPRGRNLRTGAPESLDQTLLIPHV